MFFMPNILPISEQHNVVSDFKTNCKYGSINIYISPSAQHAKPPLLPSILFCYKAERNNKNNRAEWGKVE